MDRNIQIKLALPFVLMLVVWGIGGNIPFKSSLTHQEREVYGFVPESLDLPQVGQIVINPDTVSRGVFRVPSPSGRQEQTDEEGEAEQKKKESKVTMIVIGGHRRQAMVDGNLVSEGSSVGDLVIRKIEADRVLVRTIELDTRGETRESIKWLYLGESR